MRSVVLSSVASTVLALVLACAPVAAQMPAGYGPDPALPPPDTTHGSQRFPVVTGWRTGEAPLAPAGFRVERYASGLRNPRWPFVLPNGDVLVAEAANPGSAADTLLPPAALGARWSARLRGLSADRITLFRDTTGDGRPDVRAVFLEGLNRPFGMAVVGRWFYVANTDALMRFPYERGQLRISARGEKILDLPAGGYNQHWTRNVIASPDGRKLYVTVGSATNVDVEGIDARDPRRAAILEVNPDGSGMRVFASGLRNPNGLAWEPSTRALWTAVNERDRLGDELVPDYITSVHDGAFYGWPYSYYGQHVDPRQRGRRADLVARAIRPDYATGAHTATLGITFYTGMRFPARYRGGAFVTQRGSWNHQRFVGYRVVYIPFADGRPSGPPEDFLTGFLRSGEEIEVRGRPTGIALMPDGSLLVTDDAGDMVWRVTANP